jgi:adenylosuccinate lyase
MRKLALKSEREMQPFKEILQEDKVVSKKLDKKEIDKALNPRNYLGTATSQIDSAVKKTIEERRTIG